MNIQYFNEDHMVWVNVIAVILKNQGSQQNPTFVSATYLLRVYGMKQRQFVEAVSLALARRVQNKVLYVPRKVTFECGS